MLPYFVSTHTRPSCYSEWCLHLRQQPKPSPHVASNYRTNGPADSPESYTPAEYTQHSQQLSRLPRAPLLQNEKCPLAELAGGYPQN